MDKKIYLFIIILIILTNTIYAKDLEIADNADNKVLSDIQEDAFDFYKYQDVFYPPEKELAKQGTTLESYKQSLKQSAPKNRNSTVANIWGTCPTTGTVHIPVLLVQFTDKFPMYTLEDINYYFNSPVIESNFISVSKYYNMQSYGALNLVFDVKPWTTMPRSFSYYSATADTEFQLVIDAYTTFNLDVNFAEYDNDNDGRIDGAIIIYPDYGIQGNSGMWPHTRILRNVFSNQVDGKYLGNAALVSERKSTGHNYFATVVATHEFAHILGLPDLYDTVTNNTGPIYQMSMMHFADTFCLKKPINLDVWSRYFLGWINPTTLTTFDNKNQSLRSVNDYPDAVILRNNNLNDREFFIIENRHRSATDPNNLDKCMFNNSNNSIGGFAIYHVDENKIESDFENNIINWDPDGNYYNDTTWPGITHEENHVTAFNSAISFEDLYNVTALIGRRYFDENFHMTSSAIWDMTTRSYSGNPNPLIRFQAKSAPIDINKSAIMLVGEDTVIPTIDLDEGTYLQGTEFVISTITSDANIYYTIDENIPNFESQIIPCGESITLPVGTITLKAMAKAEEYYASDVVSRTYTIIGTVNNPQATPEGGVVDFNSTITLSTLTEDAEIRYTTDFTVPTEESLLYSSPINITQDINLNIRAFKTGYIPSENINYYYSVAPVATPVASHPGGEILFRTPVTLSTTTPQATIRYTANGTEPTATSTRYTYPIYIVQPTTLKAKTFRDGQQPSETITYNYQVKLLTPRVNIESGIYPFTTKIKLTSEVPGTQIYYTTDGTDPNDGQLYNTHFRLLEDMHLRAIVKRTGYIDSEIINKTYTVSNQEQSVPKLLIDPRTPRGYESFDLIYITERHWADDVNFTITNLNSCTFNLRPIIYNDGHYTYYVFENNRCIRRIQTRLTLTVRDQNGEERADAELIVLDPGLQAIAVGRE